MSTLKVGTIQDTSAGSSSTPAQIEQGRAKAWVNFNGTGTVAIRDSYNVSSLSDDGTGKYTISYTTAMANTNYCPIQWGSAYSGTSLTDFDNAFSGGFELATGNVKVASHNPSGYADSGMYFIAVFGDQ